MAWNKPLPRTSPITGYLLARASNPALNRSPCLRALASKSRSRISSITASPAAHEIGLPSNVCPSTNPGFVAIGPQNASAISRLQIKAESGAYPPLKPLAASRMSGVTPNVSAANIRPVRPMPVMISSKIKRILLRSQISRRMGKYSSGGSITPPVWPIGSTRMAATVAGSSMLSTSSTIVAHVIATQSGLRLPERTPVTRRRKDVNETGGHRLIHGLARLEPRRRECAQGRPVP